MADEGFAAGFLDAEVGVGHIDRHRSRAFVAREIRLAIERVHRHFRPDLEAPAGDFARERGASDALAAALAQRLREFRVLRVIGVEVRGDDIALEMLAGRERGQRRLPDIERELPGHAGFAAARIVVVRIDLALDLRPVGRGGAKPEIL